MEKDKHARQSIIKSESFGSTEQALSSSNWKVQTFFINSQLTCFTVKYILRLKVHNFPSIFVISRIGHIRRRCNKFLLNSPVVISSDSFQFDACQRQLRLTFAWCTTGEFNKTHCSHCHTLLFILLADSLYFSLSLSVLIFIRNYTFDVREDWERRKWVWCGKQKKGKAEF